MLQVPDYTPVHQKRANDHKGGGIAVFIHDKVYLRILKN